MLFPLTRWERQKLPKPPLRSLLNLALAEILAASPFLRNTLLRIVVRMNEATVELADRLKVAEMFENLKANAVIVIAERQQPVTPDTLAAEVDSMLRSPPAACPNHEHYTNSLH
jgi:hypothetical protein